MVTAIQPQVYLSVNRWLLPRKSDGLENQPMVKQLNSLGDRLVAAIKLRGKTQTWLAEQVELSDNAITKWKTKGQISRESAVKVAAVLGIDLHWLLTGGGIDPFARTVNGERLAAGKRIPVVGTAQLGDNGFWSELEYPAGQGDGFVRLTSRDPNAYAVRCRGDSMKPRIKPGELVIIEPNRVPQPGDEVLVKAKNGRVMVKEWLYTRDNLVHLLSANEAHNKITIPISEIEVIHYVAGIVNQSLWEPD